uniref:Uncharacterized protein n=1 Tax=Myoviridae sp. ctbEa13 TaxID=2825136 RepID=A0A8S5VBT0_9CAUD|nr:MAG TPA: hypothetical protein [Myoviridae sp. ctbEa13]
MTAKVAKFRLVHVTYTTYITRTHAHVNILLNVCSAYVQMVENVI